MKVCSDVPEMWEEPIRKAMKIEGWDTVSAYIRDLIREDLKRKGLLGVKSLIDADGDCEVMEEVHPREGKHPLHLLFRPHRVTN